MKEESTKKKISWKLQNSGWQDKRKPSEDKSQRYQKHFQLLK